ncbi:MAG: MBL fold metallo-hydrolase [Acidobacteriota bacterium]
MSRSTSPLRVTFLGTGTSVGVPVLMCKCAVCSSSDPRNHRLRASLLLEWRAPSRPSAATQCGQRTVKVLVDTATDLRQQALRVGLDRVDGVLYTHQHVDHLLGLDELRMYNFLQRQSISLYGSDATMEAIHRTFAYAFDRQASGVPRVVLNQVSEAFELLGRCIEPIPVQHDKITVFAYRIGDFAYVTDCSSIPESSAEKMRNLEVLVIDALRREPHPAHFTLEQALAEVERLRPRQAYLTHLSHDFDHATLLAALPATVGVAYDGLVLEVGGKMRSD